MQLPLRRSRFVFCVPLLLLGITAGARAQTWISTGVGDGDDDRLEVVLTERGSIEFVETPLKDVAQTLSRQFGVPIVLVIKKLEEASVSPDTPVTIRLDDLPLESSLRLILASLELGFTIRDNVIVITTPEDVESRLITRVYPVLDLVADRTGGSKQSSQTGRADYDSLIELITSTVKPDSWDDVGGPGAIDNLDNAAALVISQTRDVQVQVERLLIALRRAKIYQGIPSLGAPTMSTELASLRYANTMRNAPTTARPWQLPQTYPAGE